MNNTYSKPKASSSSTAKNNTDKQQNLHDIELENELILSQLHHTQEELEQVTYQLSKSKTVTDKLQSRIDSIIRNNPDLWEAEYITAFALENDPQKHAIQWTAKNTYLANKLHRAISFKTFYQNGIAGITFQRDDSPDVLFFTHNSNNSEMTCLPVSGSYSHTSNAAISALSTSDWNSIKALIPKLIHTIGKSNIKSISEPAAIATVDGLKKLATALNNWPNILRYDSVSLKDSTNSSQYQSLEILLENIELGSKNYSDFLYKISSINETNSKFGQYPRLEFHENCKHAFDNWFVEYDDNRGRRFEIRFADPDQMDLGVWLKLSENDQLLMAAIISKLSDNLQAIKTKNKNKASWDQWLTLTDMIKNTLIKTFSQKN